MSQAIIILAIGGLAYFLLTRETKKDISGDVSGDIEPLPEPLDETIERERELADFRAAHDIWSSLKDSSVISCGLRKFKENPLSDPRTRTVECLEEFIGGNPEPKMEDFIGRKQFPKPGDDTKSSQKT